MPSTTELMQTELGKALVEAREKSESLKVNYKENVIGEKVAVRLSEQKALEKNPYAVAVAQAFDKMVEKTIPQDAILSAQFQSWVNRERNDLLYDSKIAKDNYFKEQTNFKTGQVTINRKNDLLQAKLNY